MINPRPKSKSTPENSLRRTSNCQGLKGKMIQPTFLTLQISLQVRWLNLDKPPHFQSRKRYRALKWWINAKKNQKKSKPTLMSRNSKCSNSWANHLERTRNPLILQKAWAKNPDKAIKFEFNLLNQECQTLEAAMALMVSSTTILEKALKIHKKNTKKARLLT